MSIILDALKKIGSADPSKRLDDFRKRAKAESREDIPAASKTQDYVYSQPKKFRLKVVAPEKEKAVEARISEVKKAVNRWPAWAQGLGLGLGLVFGCVLLVTAGKLLLTFPRIADATEGLVGSGRNMVIAARISKEPRLKNATGFWANPWVWTSSRPRETSMSIRNEIAEVMGLTDSQDTSWLHKQFRVSGIIVDKAGEEYVIINDRLLKVGDRVNGAKIMKIAPESVELSLLDQVITLEIS